MKTRANKIERIDFLKDRIKQNAADVEEYLEYESLLMEMGFSKEKIWKNLNIYGIKSWEEFIRRRNLAETDSEKDFIEIKIVGGLAGLGLALILRGLFRKSA